MGKDKYGHYVNDSGVEIRVGTDKRNTDHIDFYDKCPADNPDHVSIHINYDSEAGKGSIVDTSDGDKSTTDISCFLTTACMRYKAKAFDDNCEELTILRWFRDNFVSQEDINHYYEIAPMIVSAINKSNSCNKVYNYIYKNVVLACVDAIKNGNYDFAYNRYRASVLTLEEEFVRPSLEERFVKTLKA